MLPAVYLSISGNFRKWQVKNIAACHLQQARTSLVIQNLSSWMIFSTCSCNHSYSSLSYGSYQTLLNKTWARGCNLCSVNDKDNKCNLLCSCGWCSSSHKVSHEWLATLWECNRTNNKNNAPSPKTITAATMIRQKQVTMAATSLILPRFFTDEAWISSVFWFAI